MGRVKGSEIKNKIDDIKYNKIISNQKELEKEEELKKELLIKATLEKIEEVSISEFLN